MSRDQLEQHRDAIELLIDTTKALEDVTDVGNHWEPGEPHTLKLTIADSKDRAVSFLHNLPPDLLLVGLRAIEQAVRLEAAQTQLAVPA